MNKKFFVIKNRFPNFWSKIKPLGGKRKLFNSQKSTILRKTENIDKNQFFLQKKKVWSKPNKLRKTKKFGEILRKIEFLLN